MNESEHDVASSVFCDEMEAPASQALAESGTEYGTNIGCGLWLLQVSHLAACQPDKIVSL